MRNLENMRQKLIVAARNTPVDDHVPYAFETRIMARIRANAVPDIRGWATRFLWRSAGPFLALMIIMGFCAIILESEVDSYPLNRELEKAVYVVMDNPGETW